MSLVGVDEAEEERKKVHKERTIVKWVQEDIGRKSPRGWKLFISV